MKKILITILVIFYLPSGILAENNLEFNEKLKETPFKIGLGSSSFINGYEALSTYISYKIELNQIGLTMFSKGNTEKPSLIIGNIPTTLVEYGILLDKFIQINDLLYLQIKGGLSYSLLDKNRKAPESNEWLNEKHEFWGMPLEVHFGINLMQNLALDTNVFLTLNPHCKYSGIIFSLGI